jgi:hypothetical protein
MLCSSMIQQGFPPAPVLLQSSSTRRSLVILSAGILPEIVWCCISTVWETIFFKHSPKWRVDWNKYSPKWNRVRHVWRVTLLCHSSNILLIIVLDKKTFRHESWHFISVNRKIKNTIPTLHNFAKVDFAMFGEWLFF